METKNVYEDIVYLTFNIFKNEKTRTMIKLDNEFEEKLLMLINDILLLEKDFDASWAEKTWFSEYAKTLVNIVQKKLKFEKVDNKKVEETYKDYSDIIVYITKEFEIKRDDIVNKVSRPTVDDLKFYQIVNSEMLSRYEKREPKVEVMDDDNQIKANTSTNNNESANAGFAGGAGFNGGGFGAGFGGMPQNPMNDDRFYPFRTKPKYTRYLRFAFAVVAMIFGITTLVVFILSALPSHAVRMSDIAKAIGGDVTYKDGFSGNTGFYVGTGVTTSGASFYMSLIFTMVYIGVIVYIAQRMIRPAKTFRSYYSTPSMLYYMSVFFLVLIFIYDVYGYTSYMSFNKSKELSSLATSLTSSADGSIASQVFSTDYIGTFGEAGALSKVTDYLNSHVFTDDFMTKMHIFVGFVIFFIVSFAITFAMMVIAWVLNPKMDRQKITKLQIELQMQMQYAMQGQRYEIDRSLYTPEDEYQAVMAKIRARQSKRSSAKKDKAN